MCYYENMKTKQIRKNKRGRPVRVVNISREDFNAWFQANPIAKAAIKARAILSINDGVEVNAVCVVLDVTREAVRQWRVNLEASGLNGLIPKQRSGRPTHLTVEVADAVKEAVCNPPSALGYKQSLWTGKLVVRFIEERCGVKIRVRTAQAWLKKLGFSRQRPRKKLVKAKEESQEIFKKELKKKLKKEY